MNISDSPVTTQNSLGRYGSMKIVLKGDFSEDVSVRILDDLCAARYFFRSIDWWMTFFPGNISILRSRTDNKIGDEDESEDSNG